jgi:hypothetical protein
MRQLVALIIAAAVLAGCQTGKTDYNEKPKECSPRAIEVGYCVPGEYDNS